MRKLIVGSVVCIALVLAASSPAAAAEEVEAKVTEVGWWSSNPAAIPQSEGGFQVSADPSGNPQAVAALRVVIAPATVESLQVRFDEAGSVGTEFGALKLCGTNEAWTAANPGSLDDAPEPDCSTSAGLTRTLDGVWLAEAAALAPRGGEVTLMVVPNYQPPAPVGPPFVVSISGGDLTARGSSTSVSTIVDPSSSSGDPTVLGDSTDYFGPPASGSFGVPDLGLEPDFGTVSPEPPPATSGVVAPSSSGPDEESALGAQDFDDDSEPGPPWFRLIVLLPLSAGLGVGAARLRRALAEGLLSRA